MIKTIFLLAYEFIKVGLFTFGGGYGSLPFLFQISEKYPWFSNTDLTQMIAISGLTPGPIGLNMATYSGFKTCGIIGGIIASFALVVPMFIITTQVYRLYNKFKENRFVNRIIYYLRPTTCALISYVGIKLFYKLVLNSSFSIYNCNYQALFLVILLFILTFKLPKNPIYYMVIAGLFGIIFKILL